MKFFECVTQQVSDNFKALIPCRKKAFWKKEKKRCKENLCKIREVLLIDCL